MTIRKTGNARGCMLSPTIIAGDSSSCRDAQITITENTAMIPGIRKIRTFIGIGKGAPRREHLASTVLFHQTHFLQRRAKLANHGLDLLAPGAGRLRGSLIQTGISQVGLVQGMFHRLS